MNENSAGKVGMTQGAGPVKIYHPDRPEEAVLRDAAIAGYRECAHIGCHVRFHPSDSRQKYCDEHGTPKWAAWRTQQRAKGKSGTKDAAAVATPHPAILPSVPKPGSPPPMPPQPFTPAIKQKPQPPEIKPSVSTVTPPQTILESSGVTSAPIRAEPSDLATLLRQAADALDAVAQALK